MNKQKREIGLPLVKLLEMDVCKLRKYLSSITPHADDMCWFVPAPGGSSGKVTLVAHIDTVWDKRRRKPRIFYDSSYKAYWSPDGLGADDRAGVYALLRIYDEMPDDKKPNLLFCDEEESGCWGATDAIDVFESLLKDSLFFIELDRRGFKDAVFYNDEPKNFQSWIEMFGFKDAWGTFSDVKYLGQAFGLCTVNLSTGYFNEHMESEYLMVGILNRTIAKVKQIVTVGTDAGTVWRNPNIKPYTSSYWMRHKYATNTGPLMVTGRRFDWRKDFGDDYKDEKVIVFEPAVERDDPVPVDTFMERGALSSKLSRKERRRLRRMKQKGVCEKDQERSSKDPFHYRG